MGKINVLEKQVAELIAAGEVIERPASIAKELLENAIDAGASAVTVEVRQGGVGYLRVTDNGSGLLPEDVPTAFLRHATSKIQNADDLNFIGTLGFRGEALASIAAVSRLEMTTKVREQPLGRTIRLEGGEQLELTEAGCPNGTSVIVRDLFYNVPARLKFLRRDVSEANAVGGIVDKLAISHPEISFKWICDRKVRLHTPGDGTLLSAIHSVYGAEFAQSLLPVDYGTDGVKVTGYLSAASYTRNNRSMQHFFINGRYVRSKLCMAALEDGYKNSIMVGKYPCCVLNIELPAEMVDVNVSPSKTEVRFYQDRPVFDAVYFGVKSTLSRDDILRKMEQPSPKTQLPNLLSRFRNEEGEQVGIRPASVSAAEAEPPKPPVAASRPASAVQAPRAAYTAAAPALKEEPVFSYLKPENFQKPMPIAGEKQITYIPEEAEEPLPLSPIAGNSPAREEDPVGETGEYRFTVEPAAAPGESWAAAPISVRLIGEAFQTYVVFEVEDSLYLLDKHAAHERILYEKLKRTVSTQERQVLLQPVVVTVSAEEKQVLEEQSEWLGQMGFAVEDFGRNAVIVREVPLLLAQMDVADILLDLVQKRLEHRRETRSKAQEELLHSIACRCAMKANDHTTTAELAELLRQVYADGEIRHCPHGRPVAIALTRTELEKRFGRISS